MKKDKFQLLENQILFQIEELKRKLQEIDIKKSKDDISKLDYDGLFNRYHGAITYLNICLTCYDNPLSNNSKPTP